MSNDDIRMAIDRRNMQDGPEMHACMHKHYAHSRHACVGPYTNIYYARLRVIN